MASVKNNSVNGVSYFLNRPPNTYDLKQDFTLSDGGLIKLSYKFQKETSSPLPNDMLFLFTGILGSDQSLYIANIIEEASKRNYDICVVSFRGMSGAPIVTPKLYNSLSFHDIHEPMQYVIKEFCAHKNQRAYGLGCSLGAKILANYLGEYEDSAVLDGGVCL